MIKLSPSSVFGSPLSWRYWWPRMRERKELPEFMDDRASSMQDLAITLGDFKIINRLLSGMHGLLKKQVLARMKLDKKRTYTIVDIGIGGGDIARWLLAQCDKYGISAKVIGVDNDPRVLEYAEKACAHELRISFLLADGSDPSSLGLEVDFIIGNHFLHHLNYSAISPFIASAVSCAKAGIVIADINRSHLSFLGYSLLCMFFWRKGFAFEDGRRSVLRSFTFKEIKNIIESNEKLKCACAKQVNPFRWVVMKR